MEKPNETEQPHKMEIVVRFNMLSGEMSIEGCNKNPVVALGMLDYTLARVRRMLTQNDIAQELESASRIVPGREFRQ